ncbi:hypothetical protein AAMO2058_000180600 [Amorphochlora amoebiformis]
MDDPFDIQTSSDEEIEEQRQEWLRKKQNKKQEGKKSAYGSFVPQGDIGAQLTVEEIENFEGIVTGNYTPLAAAPSTDMGILLNSLKESGVKAGDEVKKPPSPTPPRTPTRRGLRESRRRSLVKQTPQDKGNAYASAYGGLEAVSAYGSIEGIQDGKKGAYGAYTVPDIVLKQRQELKRLTVQEKTSRIRYEKWCKEREEGDQSIFLDKDSKLDKKIGTDTTTDKTWWNKAFLDAQDLPESTPEQVLAKYRLLSKLSTDFIEIAKVYGRTVISEFFLNDKNQTVEKIGLGGVAGGKKYIVRGILFKLSVDPQIGRKDNPTYVYGGKHQSYEYAAKAAGHELKGAINMHKYYKKGICVPMQALVDFHGYRLVAMPLLPLKGGKLIYGSMDTGNSIHHDNSKFNQSMKEIAQDLHLAGHYVCDAEGVSHYIYAAGDVEGHIGSDGKYYLIDLARAFPPESIWETHHLHKKRQAVFFRMLRPEFLQWLKKNHRPNKPDEKFPALSCDALTRWGQGAQDAEEQNNRVREATTILVNKVIPEFAATFVQKTPRQLRDIQVSEELHRNGINVRHMGLVRFMITGTDDASVAAKRTLLISMVGRTLKNLLRREMRVEHDKHRNAQPSDHDSRAMVVDFLNLVTYANPEDDTTKDFWDETIPFGVMKRFGQVALTNVEKENLFSAVKEDVSKIVKYVVSTTGVQVHPGAMRTLERTGAGFEFVSVDLGALTVRVKHMSVIDYATAKVLSQEAYQGGVGQAGDRLLSLARRQFNRTLQSDPLNDVCKSEATITRLRIVARKFENRASLPGTEIRRKAQYFMLSDEKLFAAATVASRAEKQSVNESDDLANMIRAILTTWTGRRRGKQADLFRRCGGASSVAYVHRLIKFVESTRNRLLTLELCAFLATCKDASLIRHFHHFVKEIAAKDAKDIETQGIPPMEIKQTQNKPGEGKNAQQNVQIHIQEELVQRLLDKLIIKEKPSARMLVVISNLLGSTESPEFWMQAIKICKTLISTYGKDDFFRWYRGSPWNLIRSEAAGQLSDNEALCISHVIKELSPLAILDLRGLKIKKDRHVQEIAEACASLPDGTSFAELKSGHTLPVLKLRANELETVEFTQMMSHDVVWMFSLLRHNKSVQKVIIKHTELQLTECKAITHGLEGHSLRHFELRGCDVDDDELTVLCGALKNIGRLEVVKLPQNTFGNKAGKLLGQLHSITELDLSGNSKITDETAKAIAADCKALLALDMSQCTGLTDEGAKHIAKINGLRKLTLRECKGLTDAGIIAIAKGCPIEVLDVSSCAMVGDGAVRALATECKNLKDLSLHFCSNIHDSAVMKLAQSCKDSIRRLGLGHCVKLTDKSIAEIGSICKKLEALDISVCSKITDESINEVAKGCHALKELNLGICEKVTDQSLSAIAVNCTELEVLNIACCDKVTDEAITKLTACPNLRSLNLYSCKQVTGESVKEVGTKCSKLRHLDLFWCEGIKEDAIEALMKNCPECKIDR